MITSDACLEWLIDVPDEAYLPYSSANTLSSYETRFRTREEGGLGALADKDFLLQT